MDALQSCIVAFGRACFMEVPAKVIRVSGISTIEYMIRWSNRSVGNSCYSPHSLRSTGSPPMRVQLQLQLFLSTGAGPDPIKAAPLRKKLQCPSQHRQVRSVQRCPHLDTSPGASKFNDPTIMRDLSVVFSQQANRLGKAGALDKMLEGAKALIVKRCRSNGQQFGDRLPHATEGGHYHFKEDGGWTGGFWSGLLFIAYQLSGEFLFMEQARASRKRILCGKWKNQDVSQTDRSAKGPQDSVLR